MLIIEVDGMTHQWEEVAENDKIREEALTAMGFTIMRFDDDDVLTAINGVYYQIEDFIIEFEQKSTPNPRQRGTSTATSSSKNTGITPKLIR